MIKKKTNPAMLLYPLFTGMLLAISGAGTEDSFLEYLEGLFEKYGNNYSIERTYLMTDRFVYRPGEDLWFKGFVTSGSPGSHLNSEDFFIRLLNKNGEEIIYRRYPLTGNETSGRLIVPRSCIPGKYWLVAYTGWMKNRCPQEAFRKEILVSRYFEKRFQVETLFDKLAYKPGDTLTAQIRIVDPAGRPVAETNYDYMLETFRKTDIKGSGKTDIKGKSKITFTVPGNEDLLMLTFEIRSRRLSGDYSMIVPVMAGETTVNFFPEGGSLVMGLPSVVGFTAKDKYGLPQMVSGVLIDNTGRILDTLTTAASGIGKFEFTPGPDSVYLKITYPEGQEQKYPLPWPKTLGSVIRYTGQSNDSARFIITNSEPGMQKTYWICVLNRKIVCSSIESFSGSKSLSIPVYGLNNGIMQVTVFDQNYNIVAERLVRVQNQKDELRIQMERQQYKSRQRVSLLVEYPVNLIRSDLALSVSLANLAHHPYNPTFIDVITSKPCGSDYPYDAKDNDPDLLAAVNYPVNWKEILTYGGVQSPYRNQDGLTGIVYDKKDNISPHAKVRITHFPNFRLYETQTDETGSFRVLFGSDIIDYKFLNIDAYDALGKTNLSARVDYSYMEELHKSLFAETMSSEQEKVNDLDKYGEPDLVYDLRYGPGKFRKSGTETRKKYDPYQYANYTDIMDIIQDLQPCRLSDNKIYFYDRNRGDTTINTEAIIVVNGALKGTNTGALKNIIPSDITNINISNALLDIRKYTPLNFSSVIEITTIQGMSRYKDAHVQTGQGILNTDREFYSPDYAVESSYSADNRKTLYWNPNISLYQGNSVVLTFYTSDVKGTFNGHITGLDKDGNPVEKTFTFIVE